MGRTPPPFLGRTEELKALESRCSRPGLTIVKGPPRIGKTRLLREFVNESRAVGSRRIGMGEAQGASGDVLLRAIKNAYDHWISDEGAMAQLKTIHAQMDGKYTSKAGIAFGKALGKFTGPFEDMVKTVFSSLEEAQRMIDGGGLTLPRLSAEAAYDLVTLLATGQPTPVVAVLNQWEDGSRLKEDVETLKAFLDNLREWPSFHVVLHLRNPHFDDEDHIAASKQASKLAQLPGAESIEVGPIDFENDHTAYANVIAWLAAEFPALAGMEAGDHTADLVMEMVRGNPAVLDEWWYLSDEDSASIDRMAAVAKDAQALYYPELWDIYRRLLDEAHADDSRVATLEVALLAAVLPLPPNANERAILLPAVQGAATDHDVVRLESTRLFRSDDNLPLSLGHPSRREAAERGILGQNELLKTIDEGLAQGLRPFLRVALDRIVPALIELHTVDDWDRLDSELEATVTTIAGLSSPALLPCIRPRTRLLCELARTMLGDDDAAIADSGNAETLSDSGPVIRCFVSWGMFNIFNTNATDRVSASRFLDDLRAFAKLFPEDQSVRARLASALTNATYLSGPDFQRADTLFAELLDLCNDFPKVQLFEEQAAMALGGMIHQASLAKSTDRAACKAEALKRFRSAVLGMTDLQGDFLGLFREVVGVAAEIGDTDAERRLRAVYEALFGEDGLPDGSAEPTPPTAGGPNP